MHYPIQDINEYNMKLTVYDMYLDAVHSILLIEIAK